jgi:hypothetical protein
MPADVGGKDAGDGSSVSWRAGGYPLEGVDAAEPHVEVVLGAADVLDGAAEALGQLAFLGDGQPPAGGLELLAGGLEGVVELLAAELELPPGEVGAQQQDAAGEALEQRGPGVVL